MTINDLILKEIDKYHEADSGRNIDQVRERLLNDLLSRRKFDIRQGKITDTKGIEVDLKEILGQLIDSSFYVGRPANATDKIKFVSQWPRPSAEERSKIAKDVRNALDKLIKINSIQFTDKESSETALDLISHNMIFGYDDSGNLFFQKFNPSGLTGEKFYSFSEIIPGHLVDQEATTLQQELKTSNLKDIARKLLDQKTARPQDIQQKVDALRKQEVLSQIPRKSLPRIPRSLIEKEFLNREAALRALDPTTTAGQPLRIIQTAARAEMMKLSDIGELQAQLKQIKPKPAEDWQGVPY